MIVGFEEYTHELTDSEKIIIEIIQQVLIRTNKSYPLTNTDIKEYVASKGYRTSAPRIRHMIHVLRVSDSVRRLIANSNGYYVSGDLNELKTYQDSLDDRLRSIYNVRRAIKRQIKQITDRATQTEIIFPDE